MVLPRDLVARHRAGRLVPFVGAGVSKAVRRRGSAEPLFPTWPELLRSATDLLEAEQVDIRQLLQSPNANLQEIARRIRRLSGQRRWNRFLREQFDRDYSEVDPRSLKLAAAVWALKPSTVITTNYDRVLLWACPEARQKNLRVISLDSGVDFETVDAASADRPVLWHLHGRSENPATLILTPDGYDQLYNSNSRTDIPKYYQQAIFTLRSVAASRSLLFIGWSATDAALLDDLIRVQLLFENSTIEHYVICRTAESAVVRGLLEQRGLDAGVITVEDFGEPLIRALEEIEEASASTQSTDSSQVTIDRKANSVPRLPLRRRCRTVPDSFGDLDPALPRAFSEGHTLDDHAVLLKAARRSQSSLATALSQATVLEFDGAIELMALELGNVQFLGMEEAYRRLFRGIAFEKLKQFDEAIADYDWIQRNVPDDDELVTCAAFNRMICLEKLGDYSAASFGRWIGDRDRVLRPGDLLWTKAFNMELVRAARAQQRTDHEDVLPLALEAEQASCPAGYAKTVINWSIYQGTDLGDDVVYDILRVAGSQPVNTSTGILHHCQTFAERTGDTILENAIRSAFDAALVRSRESATVERFLHQ